MTLREKLLFSSHGYACRVVFWEIGDENLACINDPTVLMNDYEMTRKKHIVVSFRSGIKVIQWNKFDN